MFKKKLLSVAVAALLTGTVYATPNLVVAPAPLATAVAPVDNLAPRAPAVALPAEPAKSERINPFMGKPLSVEARQRELELAKMETALLEERIKQASLNEDLLTIPLKKAVEAAQATTARLKEELAQKEAARVSTASRSGTAANAAIASTPADLTAVPAPRKARPKKAIPVAKVEPTLAPSLAVAPVPMAPDIEVTSVLSLGGARSAVLDISGNILTVRNGDKTAFGTVEIIDGQTVRLGGQVHRVHGATLARLTISDPKPVDPMKQALPTVAPPATGAAGGMPPPPAIFPSTSTAPRNGPPVLPPLQLPAGVTLLPTPR